MATPRYNLLMSMQRVYKIAVRSVPAQIIYRYDDSKVLLTRRLPITCFWNSLPCVQRKLKHTQCVYIVIQTIFNNVVD